MMFCFFFCLFVAFHPPQGRAGFPFHTDIHANGDETYIVGFRAPALMEFIHHNRHDKEEIESQDVIQVAVEPGDLVGLTGEVRNKWMHRVVPGDDHAAARERLSLVLGCRPAAP